MAKDDMQVLFWKILVYLYKYKQIQFNVVKSMNKITDEDRKIIKKYNINIDNNMTIKDILILINLKILDVGLDYNDEINEKGIELERLYDSIYYNNKKD